MFAILVAVVLGQAAVNAPAPVTDVRRLQVSPPKVLAEIDSVKVEGTPIGLAWRTDGALYLRVTQGKDKDGKERVRHYQFTTQPALSVGQTDGTPQWAASYWIWKSSVAAPGDPALKIDVEQRKTRETTINTPGGAAIAGINTSGYIGDTGGQGISPSEVAAAAFTGSTVGTVTMRFKGQVVGEWKNEYPQPGMRFGWAPAPMGVLAYAEADKRRLALLDSKGHKVVIPGTSDVLLPAWSTDGTRVAYLQKKSEQLYLLMVVDIR